VRIALLSVGFFAGLWLHEAGLLDSQDAVSPRYYKLASIRQTIEADSCAQVRMVLRVVNGDGEAVVEPVLVCDGGEANGVDAPVNMEQISFPFGSGRVPSPDAGSFDGL
jgi:hypothetical protein